jgi:hypothetical protein
MKVYALVSNYFNGCDFFECIIDLYQEKQNAEDNCLELMCKSSDPGQDYYVKEMDVK